MISGSAFTPLPDDALRDRAAAGGARRNLAEHHARGRPGARESRASGARRAALSAAVAAASERVAPPSFLPFCRTGGAHVHVQDDRVDDGDLSPGVLLGVPVKRT